MDVVKPLARAAVGLLSGAVAFAAVDARELPRAEADDALPTSVAAAGCVLRGSGPVPRGTQLFDQPSGGRVIANFTGAVVPIALSSLPGDPTIGRSHVSTHASGAALRIDGYAAASAFPTYTTRDLTIVPGHVWIAGARRVRLVQATTAALTAELTILGSANQTARASAPCDAFSLQRGTPQPMDVPGNGRLYSTKTSLVELYDQPNGSVVFSLRMIEGTSQLFWSTESRAGFVHLLARADIVVDGWARVNQLEPMKRGEMVDQVAPSQ
ncbi:MAG TPA: hypothetical protein VHB21_05040, partial [Minicystis sp.]|nr:hypothetical protein [Minicystis sp.]